MNIWILTLYSRSTKTKSGGALDAAVVGRSDNRLLILIMIPKSADCGNTHLGDIGVW